MKKVINYIGSKVKLYDFIEETIINNMDKNKDYNFLDLFSGTNSVSNFIKENTKWNIIANDKSLYSKIIFSFIKFDLLSDKEKKDLIQKLEILDGLELIEGDIYNELSYNGKVETIEKEIKDKIFHNQPINSRMFFSSNVGKKIDTVKKQIKEWYEQKEITELEKDILLTFVIHYADKNANTTSVYGAYLKNTKKMDKEYPFKNNILLEKLKSYKQELNKSKKEYKIYQLDIIKILELINSKNFIKEKNIIYLDPPYSTRSYESNYHILEYVADLNFNKNYIKQNSKTAQRKNDIKKEKNPFTSKQETKEIFEKMIQKSLKISNNLFISYSTDGLITEENIKEIYEKLSKDKEIFSQRNKKEQLELKTYKKSYKRFKAVLNQKQKKEQQLNNILKNSTKENKKKKNIDTEKIFQGNKEEKELFEIIWHFKII